MNPLHGLIGSSQAGTSAHHGKAKAQHQAGPHFEAALHEAKTTHIAKPTDSAHAPTTTTTHTADHSPAHTAAQAHTLGAAHVATLGHASAPADVSSAALKKAPTAPAAQHTESEPVAKTAAHTHIDFESLKEHAKGEAERDGSVKGEEHSAKHASTKKKIETSDKEAVAAAIHLMPQAVTTSVKAKATIANEGASIKAAGTPVEKHAKTGRESESKNEPGEAVKDAAEPKNEGIAKVLGQPANVPSSPTASPTVASTTVTDGVPTTTPVAPPPPALAAVPTSMWDDPSLLVALSPHTARVAVETADAGSLSVRLKVNDGVADVQLAGPAAHLLEMRQNELRVAFAQEGLSLGQFDLTQSDGQRQQQTFEREPAPPRSPKNTASPTKGTTRHDGRLSVKA